MKILLAYPYFLDPRIHQEDIRPVPMGVYYIGALLREKGHQVLIADWHDRDRAPARIEPALRRAGPDILGISIVHANRWGGIEVARIAKRLNPRVRVVFGGIGATFLWRHLLTRFPEIDYIVLGEGEYPFLELAEALEKGAPDRAEHIRGLAFRKAGEAVRTPAADPVADLDELPNPARHFTYQHLALTRGCPANCAFCGSPRFWKRRVRFHSPEYFVEQMTLLAGKGIRFFFVSDDTFTLDKPRVIDICRRIIERSLRVNWAAISRVDLVDREVLAWMRKAGCIQISYGIESGSRRIRRVLHKRIDEQQAKAAFSLTTSFGILPRAYFIYGSPGENAETIQETLDLIRVLKPLSAIFYILDLFPGTALYEDFLRRSGASDDIWLKQVEDLMYFETDPRLPAESVLAFGRELRDTFHASLPGFAESIELLDDEEFYPLHADFLSRLGMTFSLGDYAAVDAIPAKRKTARRLFERALGYHPDPRAFLGLAVLEQKEGNYPESIRILNRGLACFPGSETLSQCLAVSLMNLGRHAEARECLARLPDSSQTAALLRQCEAAPEKPAS